MAFSQALLSVGFDQNYGYTQKLINLFGPSSIVALWPQNEASGTVSLDIGGRGLNGAYTGVTLGQPGIGDGNTAASYDGTTSFNNVYSSALNTAFNGNELTYIVWGKASGAGIWTDGLFHTLIRLQADSNNLVWIRKNSVNNTLEFFDKASATVKNVTSTGLAGSTVFFCVALAVSKSGDFLKAYINGAQVGATQTGLGNYTGALASNDAVIGAGITTPAEVWSGTIGPVLLLNRAATAAEIAIASVVP